MTVLVRDAAKYRDESAFEALISKVIGKFDKSYDFNSLNHVKFVHHEQVCPPATIDLLTMNGAISISEFQKKLMGGDFGFDDDDDAYMREDL